MAWPGGSKQWLAQRWRHLRRRAGRLFCVDRLLRATPAQPPRGLSWRYLTRRANGVDPKLASGSERGNLGAF